MARTPTAPEDPWHDRARAYDAACSRYPLLTTLADRLVADVPPEAVDVLDLAGGSGLVSERLLFERPESQVTLLEPAAEMRVCARERLGDRVRLLDAVAADLPATGLRVDAVLCSAAMHLLDEAVVFPRVAQILRPGGVFAFNLWWHSFDETAPDEPESWWEQVVDEEVRQAGFATPDPPAWTPARERSRAELVQLAASHGLALRSLVRDADAVPGAFFVDFAAMRPDWLADLGEARDAVLARARARCTRPVEVVTVRLLFARSCVEAA